MARQRGPGPGRRSMEADPASDNRSSRASRASSSAASPKAASPRPPPAAAAAAAIEEAAAAEQERLAQQLSDTVEELAAAREDLQRRKDSHLRREKKMQDEIAHLNHALQEAIGARSAPEQMQTIRSTHGAIQDRLSDMQGRTVELLNQQKEAMARQFRMRLAEVVEAKTKSNEQEHSAEEWASRFGKAQDHLKRTETQLIDADRRNKLLEAENKRMRSQYRSQENDREFLVRQLVSVKRDNARLREELQRSNARNASAASAASAADGGSSVGGSSRPGTAGSYRSVGSAGSRPPSAGGPSNERLRETIQRMRKTLDRERAQLRQVRAAYATDQQNRTELEVFLSQAIEDVRKVIVRRRSHEGRPSSRHGRPASAASRDAGGVFGEEDREKVIETLLAKERVVTLLYNKAFVRGTPPSSSRGAAVGGGQGQAPRPQTAMSGSSSGSGPARPPSSVAVGGGHAAVESLRRARPSSAPSSRDDDTFSPRRETVSVYGQISLLDEQLSQG